MTGDAREADVSVIVPAYNAEAFIGEAIDSVLSQAGCLLQVIVVDDQSSDRTREAVEAYGDAVTLLTVDHGGPGAARNTGARLATGEYLAFLDADDVWLPRKLERQIHALHDSRVDMVFGHCRDFYDPGLTAEQRTRFTCRPDPYPFPAPSTCVLRREAFLHAGDFPDFHGGEFIAWYGWTQTLGMRPLVLPEVCAMRRVHAGNSSRDPRVMAAYPQAARWVLHRRRQQAKGACGD